MSVANDKIKRDPRLTELLKPRTDEELAEYQPVSVEEIDAALDQGRQERDIADSIYVKCTGVNKMNNKKIYEVHVYADGTKMWYMWYIDGKFHREDGPAVEWADGTKMWYINGKRHREDGPAVENVSGLKEWWIDGTQFTESEFNSRNKCENKVVEIDGKKYKLVPVE